MDFVIENHQENIVQVARKIGYVIIDSADNGQYNLVRKLTGNNYPRFHVYLKVAGDRFIFSLHLDQKAPIYKGSHAHNGEYNGPIVEKEAERITLSVQEVSNDE
jgi:hypothetical protein